MLSKNAIELFELEVIRERLKFLKDMLTRGQDVDEAEIARVEAELAAEEARLRERSSEGDAK